MPKTLSPGPPTKTLAILTYIDPSRSWEKANFLTGGLERRNANFGLRVRVLYRSPWPAFLAETGDYPAKGRLRLKRVDDLFGEMISSPMKIVDHLALWATVSANLLRMKVNLGKKGDLGDYQGGQGLI